MAIQFPCPEGHLLEAEESAVGQPCRCPTCGVQFVIPSRPIGRASSHPPIDPPPIISESPAASLAPELSPLLFGAPSRPAPVGSPSTIDISEASRALHIPCPNGHELETPRELLGQYVMCPHCGVQYRLREQDSVEFQRKKLQEREVRERKVGKAWLNWAVLITVLVLLGLLGLILSSSGR